MEEASEETRSFLFESIVKGWTVLKNFLLASQLLNLLRMTSMNQKVLQEVHTQIPFEMFDVSKFVCGTYVDSRMIVLIALGKIF